MLEPSLSPESAFDLLHAPRQLRRLLLDPHRGAVSPELLDCAAHMVLLADDFDRMMEPALARLCRELGATRCDAGLGRPDDRWFVSTCQQTEPGAEVLDVVGLPLPNHHHVPQRSWHAQRPLAFDLEHDPSCADLGTVPALAQSRQILVRRLAWAGQAVGQVCADQVADRHEWSQADLQCFDDHVSRFASPLAFLAAVARRAEPDAPSPAELDAIRLLAQGRTYKAIARELGKSPRTIANQLARARERTGARNEVELVRRCRRWFD